MAVQVLPCRQLRYHAHDHAGTGGFLGRDGGIGGLFQRVLGRPSPEDRALAGDRDAWDQLVRAHNPRLVAFLIRRGARPQVARELAQDVWIRLMERQREGKLDRIELPGLALQTARFLLSNHRQKRTEDLPDDWPPRGGPTLASHEDAVAARRELGALESALGGLSQRKQDVFRMTYQEHLDAPSIAQRLGLSHQRVRQILSEVRRDLRTAVER
jgi:RNA polymerase sigma-70 factor (ECF subfamily)